MIKYYFGIVVILTFWSCNYQNKESSGKETHKKINNNDVKADTTKQTELTQKVKTEEVYKIDIELIKKCGIEGISSFNMDSISDPKKYLDNSIIENTLGKILVNESKDWYLKVNQWERFSCYQWEENEQYFLFTLLQQDESCCLTMYLCITNKDGEILLIRQLGLSGGDGGWFENDWGEKIDFGQYKITYDSYYDEEKVENGDFIGYTREHEFTELMIKFDSGKLKIDTLNYFKKDTLMSN